MQDAEKLQLAVEQMQQILDKAHQIVHDPNLPNLLAAYDVTRALRYWSLDTEFTQFHARYHLEHPNCAPERKTPRLAPHPAA